MNTCSPMKCSPRRLTEERMVANMLRVLCLAVLLCLPGVSGVRADAAGDAWLTASATTAVVRNDAQPSSRLSRPLNPAACSSGGSEFVASWQGKKFLAPCRFIHETISHLRAASKTSATQTNFPLRTDHVHLAVPAELWEEKYSRLPKDEILSAVLRESRLVAVYHANDALTLADSEGEKAEPTKRPPYDNRQVLGYYDGRVIEILPARANALADRYRSVAWFYFLPRRLDAPTAFSGNEAVTFDVSFDHDLAIDCATSGPMESGKVRIKKDEPDHAQDCGEPSQLSEGR
jgi:hypothetical protein